MYVLVLTGLAPPTQRAVGNFPTIEDAHAWLAANGANDGRWLRVQGFDLIHPDDPTCGDYIRGDIL